MTVRDSEIGQPSVLTGYDPELVDPLLRSGDFGRALHEASEQIYEFRLFTPEACRLIIAEAERCGGWRTKADILDHPYDADCKNPCFTDTTLELENMPAAARLYAGVVEHHFVPMIAHLWPVFRLQKVNPPYILKYHPSVVGGMAAHYDLETIGLVVYLNDDFEGGGTRFPRWNYTTSHLPVGSAVIYPGGLSHVHEGLPITSGTRYLMCGAFF